jgi:hypothetical protein
MSRRLLFRLSCLAAFCCPAISFAEEPAPTAEVKAPAATATAAEISDLVKQLDADDFKARQLAAEKLSALGKPAIPALIDAAQSSQLELMSQALGILRGFHQDNNADLKTAAKEALEKVAAGTNPNAAQRAKDLLAPPKSADNDPNRNNIIAGNGQGQIIINGAGGINGRIQIQGGIPIQIGGGMRVSSKSVSNKDGVKTTKVKQDGVEVEIIESKEEITVKKTENGKTEEFKAKDAEELKKKHPAGHELFDKHAGDKNNGAANAIGLQINGGNIQAIPNIQIAQPIPLPAQALPMMPLQPAIPVNAGKIRVESQLQAVERMIESAEMVLSRSGDTADVKEATKAVSEHLAKAKAELAKAKEKLGANAPKNGDGAEVEKIRKNIEEMKKAIADKDEVERAKVLTEAQNAIAKESAAKEVKHATDADALRKVEIERVQAIIALEKAKVEAEQARKEAQKALEEANRAREEALKKAKE